MKESGESVVRESVVSNLVVKEIVCGERQEYERIVMRKRSPAKHIGYLPFTQGFLYLVHSVFLPRICYPY